MGSPLVPEQADKAKGKNVIISEPRVAPNVEFDQDHRWLKQASKQATMVQNGCGTPQAS
jgi:hypothetical protein